MKQWFNRRGRGVEVYAVVVCTVSSCRVVPLLQLLSLPPTLAAPTVLRAHEFSWFSMLAEYGWDYVDWPSGVLCRGL